MSEIDAGEEPVVWLVKTAMRQDGTKCPLGVYENPVHAGGLDGCLLIPVVPKADYDLVVASQLRIARTYDPNCDVFVESDEIEKMKAARQSIEALQELASSLGSDPEGCLTDVPDSAMGDIETLRASRERAEADAAALRACLEMTGVYIGGTVGEFKRNHFDGVSKDRLTWVR